MSLERLRQLANEHGLQVRDCGGGHIQVRGGAVVVNWYPFARRPTVYANGTSRALKQVPLAQPERVIEMALGELDQARLEERKGSDWTRRERRRLLRQPDPRCIWCREPMTKKNATLEHVVPLDKGGTNRRENLALACEPCNQEHANKVEARPDTSGCVPGGVIQLASGRYVDPLNLKPDDILVSDIAHALANIGRFTGHARRHYSVAEHSLLVAELAPDGLKLEALLHDAGEAYLGDVARPLKIRPEFAFFREAEARAQAAIEQAFGLLPGVLDCEEIQAADNMALAIERRDLMPPGGEWPGLPEPLTRIVIPEQGYASSSVRQSFERTVWDLLGLRAPSAATVTA